MDIKYDVNHVIYNVSNDDDVEGELGEEEDKLKKRSKRDMHNNEN